MESFKELKRVNEYGSEQNKQGEKNIHIPLCLWKDYCFKLILCKYPNGKDYYFSIGNEWVYKDIKKFKNGNDNGNFVILLEEKVKRFISYEKEPSPALWSVSLFARSDLAVIQKGLKYAVGEKKQQKKEWKKWSNYIFISCKIYNNHCNLKAFRSNFCLVVVFALIRKEMRSNTSSFMAMAECRMKLR